MCGLMRKVLKHSTRALLEPLKKIFALHVRKNFPHLSKNFQAIGQGKTL